MFAVATGFQYELSERITLRAGYLFNTNPIPAPATVFNIQAPGITQHTLSFGVSTTLTENITLTSGYVHGFRNAISGPILEVPGSSSRLDVQTKALVAGITVRFGARRSAKAADVFAPIDDASSPMPAVVGMVD